MGIDGTVLDTPDTPANAERFGRSGGGRGRGAVPQLRKVSLVELGTHVEVALALGGWQDGEPKLVERLWELVFDEQKTHLDPRRAGKPAHFRSQTPAGVEQEVYAVSLGHFAVPALMLEAARVDDLDVARLSFAGCLRILQARLPECESSTPARLERWYRLVLAEMAAERIEPRRNRSNPRVVKRTMSKFAKKRAEHRGRPPLRKSFAETVVIT